MKPSNRFNVQMSVLAAALTVGVSGLNIANAQVPGVEVEISKPAANSAVTLEERQFNSRLLLRYKQLWNMYRFRNEAKMTTSQREKVDALIDEVQSPRLHADMPRKDIQAKIASNAIELTKLLKAETANSATSDHAAANLAYLQGTLLKGMSNPKTFAMDRKKFREEFLAVLPADPSLPDSITRRTSSGDVKPPASASSGTIN